jgi:hypothetical protein
VGHVANNLIFGYVLKMGKFTARAKVDKPLHFQASIFKTNPIDTFLAWVETVNRLEMVWICYLQSLVFFGHGSVCMYIYMFVQHHLQPAQERVVIYIARSFYLRALFDCDGEVIQFFETALLCVPESLFPEMQHDSSKNERLQNSRGLFAVMFHLQT